MNNKKISIFNAFFNKKTCFPLIASCIVVPLLFWILVFQLDSNISANSYLVSAPLCLIGIVYPTVFFPFALVYILNNIFAMQKIQYAPQKAIWSFIGQIMLYSLLVTFVGACVETLLMLCVSFIPHFDSNHLMTAAFRWIFSNHSVLVCQNSYTGYVFWTIFMALFSFMALAWMNVGITLLLSRFISKPVYILFALFMIIVFQLVFSDAILIPDIFAHQKGIAHFAYVCPMRYGMWSYFFSLSGNSSVYFVFDDYDSHAKAFHSIAVSLPSSYAWVVLFGGIYWLFISFDFKKIWKSKK